MSEALKRGLSTGRAVDRLINFSDAVVAVAITLMALPLVDIGGPGQGETILTVFGHHWPQLVTFLFTFFVVAIMWSAHNRILNGIRAYDPPIFWINTSWLAGIVLLPWFTAMRDSTDASSSGAACAYWVLLAIVSALGSVMAWHIRRHRELLDPHEVAPDSGARVRLRGVAFAGLFLLIGIVSLWSADVASWLPIAIIPLSIWLRPAREDAPTVS
jgi:uncharacterized membrane protein